jgi:hypothetical protein
LSVLKDNVVLERDRVYGDPAKYRVAVSFAYPLVLQRGRASVIAADDEGFSNPPVCLLPRAGNPYRSVLRV